MSNPSGFSDFSFDENDDKVGKKTKQFKGKEGETYRVSFVHLPIDASGQPLLDGKIKFTGCDRHYVQGVGYFLHKGPEYAKLAGGAPKQAVATILVVWPTTDKKGKLNADAFSKGEGWQVMPWVFSADRYDQLKRRHEEFPLNTNDITLACTDSQYQKMDVSPCKDNLFRKLWESDKERAKAVAKAIFDEVQNVAKGLAQSIARDMTLDQIREKLGGASASAGPITGATSEDVDNLLDNLIE